MYLSVKNEIPNYNEALAESYGFYNFTGLYTKENMMNTDI